MTFRLACDAADLFAATAPAGGGLATSCDPVRAASVLIINNADDPIVPVILGEIAFDQLAQENSCGPERVESSPAANAVCERALACRDDVSTQFCVVSGISHVWPGGVLDARGPFRATDAVWDFFAASRPREG